MVTVAAVMMVMVVAVPAVMPMMMVPAVVPMAMAVVMMAVAPMLGGLHHLTCFGCRCGDRNRSGGGSRRET